MKLAVFIFFWLPLFCWYMLRAAVEVLVFGNNQLLFQASS